MKMPQINRFICLNYDQGVNLLSVNLKVSIPSKGYFN